MMSHAGSPTFLLMQTPPQSFTNQLAPPDVLATQQKQLEGQWPAAAAALLLRLPRGDRDAEAPLFTAGLAVCTFHEYLIDTWQQARACKSHTFCSTSTHHSRQSGWRLRSYMTSPGHGLLAFFVTTHHEPRLDEHPPMSVQT